MTPPESRLRLAGALETAALAVLLAVMAARPFVNEMPFRVGLRLPAPSAEPVPLPPSDDLFRVGFAMLLLTATALWAVASAIRGRLLLGGLTFGLLAAAFAAFSIGSCPRAADARAAWIGWLEHISLLAAAFLAIQLAGRGRRWTLVLVVLAALAASMGAKAVVQRWVEYPQRVAQFETDRDKQLETTGLTPGTPNAARFEKRLLDPAAFGYLFLSNPFASLMVVLMLAAAGVAVERIAAANRARILGPPLRSGEIRLETVAAALSAIVVCVSAVALFLSLSKGGIAAGAAGLLLAAALLWRSEFFARHRRAALTAAAGTLALVIAGVVVLGLVRVHVPSRSLQVRWEYWTGSARIIQDCPLRGVGAGNFGDAYLRHRLPQASESTKLAHNAPLDAACQFGLPATAAMLAAITWLVVVMTRPAAPTEPEAPGRADQPIFWLVLLPLAVLVVRAARLGSTNPPLLFIDAVIPAAALAAGLLVAMWIVPKLVVDGGLAAAARIVAGCGLGAFLLHNLVESTLFAPATATIFWVVGGALAGAGCRWRDLSPGALARGATVILSVAALAAAGWFVFGPVAAAGRHIHAAEAASARGELRLAARELALAAQADPLDAHPPAELARLKMSVAAVAPPTEERQAADDAVRFAESAWSRTHSPENADLTSDAYWLRDEPSSYLLSWRRRESDSSALEQRLAAAMERTGPTVSLLSALAEVKILAGQPRQAMALLTQAMNLAKDSAPKLYDHFGDVAWQLGWTEEAKIAWAKYRGLAGEALAHSPAVRYAALAVRLDPMDMTPRLPYAELLYAVGDFGEALRDIAEIRRIDAALPADSDMQLSPAQRDRLTLLERKIAFARPPATTP